MPLLPKARSLYRTLFRQGRLERDLDDELSRFVEDLTEKHVRDEDMSPEAARRAALMEVGRMDQVKEHVRSGRIGSTIESAVQDLRYAWRGLWKSPGFALVLLPPASSM